MMRIVTLTENDILTDPEGSAGTLARALRRRCKMRFVSFCPIGGEFLAVFEELPPDAESECVEFVFSAFADSSFDGVTSEIRARYDASYTTLATFFINGTLWGLFRR